MNPIRELASNEEFDYVLIKGALKDYLRPRDKISALLKAGDIVRVKKGLYIFGKALTRGAVVKETLANLIYGPSYVSLEYALSFYSLIPERVDTITSVTFKRNKSFKTPVGVFSYQHIKPQWYQVGVCQISVDETHFALMASKEKAIADMLCLSPKAPVLDDIRDLRMYLFDNLRVAPNVLSFLNTTRVRQIAKIYGEHNIDLLLQLMMKGKR